MSKPNAFIGIDPGAKGAICVVVPTENIQHFLTTVHPPDKIYESLLNISGDYNLSPIMIENVSSIPGAAAGSNFKFGFNVGLLQGIIKSTAIGMDTVRPKAWQKEIGVGTKFKGNAIKKEVARLANQLYPKAELYGPRGGLLDGRSDALMIAHHCLLKYT